MDFKDEISVLEQELYNMKAKAELDKEKFLKFAFGFVENMGRKFLEISPENRIRCKQIVFPAGFYMDADNKVYTPEISTLYRLAGNKKDLSITDKSLLVQHS